MNLPLKVDKLVKYDKCIKKLRREKLKKIFKNRDIKKVIPFFDSGVLFCKPLTKFKNFRWPVKIVKLKKIEKFENIRKF